MTKEEALDQALDNLVDNAIGVGRMQERRDFGTNSLEDCIFERVFWKNVYEHKKALRQALRQALAQPEQGEINDKRTSIKDAQIIERIGILGA